MPAAALVFAATRTAVNPSPVFGMVSAGPESDAAKRNGLVLHDGDRVEASGAVEDGHLCAPAPTGAVTCPYGIAVPGVAATGGTTLRGRWHAGGLSDIEQLPYAPSPAGELGDGPVLPDSPPCPAPPGGWRAGEDTGSDDRIRDHLRAHPDRFAEPFATHSGNARILVVEVVRGDIERARTELTAIDPGNLCVVAAPGGRSIAEDDELQATAGTAVRALMNDPASGIYLTSPEDGRIRVLMVQLTPALYDRLATIGLDRLVLDPWIRPVHS